MLWLILLYTPQQIEMCFSWDVGTKNQTIFFSRCDCKTCIVCNLFLVSLDICLSSVRSLTHSLTYSSLTHSFLHSSRTRTPAFYISWWIPTPLNVCKRCTLLGHSGLWDSLVSPFDCVGICIWFVGWQSNGWGVGVGVVTPQLQAQLVELILLPVHNFALPRKKKKQIQ